MADWYQFFSAQVESVWIFLRRFLNRVKTLRPDLIHLLITNCAHRLHDTNPLKWVILALHELEEEQPNTVPLIVSNKSCVLSSSHSVRQFDTSVQPHTLLPHVPANLNPQAGKRNRNTSITTVFHIRAEGQRTREAKLNRDMNSETTKREREKREGGCRGRDKAESNWVSIIY